MNFQCDCARDHIAAGEVFGIGRIALHEALAVFVDEITALTTHALGNQRTGTRNAGWVKLPELHVFQRKSGAQREPQAIASIDERIGGVLKNAPRAAGSQHGGTRFYEQRLAGFDFQRDHTQHIALRVFY